MTHDYKRHGTTTLFAAMNTQDGTVIDLCLPTHTHKDAPKKLAALQSIERHLAAAAVAPAAAP
jgi:hypothetical protein